MPRVLALLAVLSLGATGLLAQSGNDLFQKALSKERVEGQFAEAIVLYERIVSEFAADRALAAKALLQMGRCYERLGKSDAQRAYEQIVREFADQRAAADEARRRLADLAQGRSTATDAPSARLVWSAPNLDTRGAPSPDGRLVSYIDYSHNRNGDLAVFDLVTRRTRGLTQGDSAVPGAEFAEWSVFSADGRQIAYAWFNRDGFRELRVAALDRSGFRTIYRNPELGYLEPVSWSPDGKFVVTLLEGRDGSTHIGLVPTAGGTLRVLKTLSWKWPAGVSVSPDGRYIAYAAPVDPALTRDVFLLALDGTRESVLAAHEADDISPMWTPDGSGVIFLSDRSGTRDAWLVPMKDGRPTGSPTAIRRNLGRGRSMGLTRNGELFYALMTSSQDVYTGTIDPVSGRVTAESSVVSQRFVGSNYGPDWSPDGNRLAYVSQRAPGGPGASAIVIRSLPDGKERDIVPRLQYFLRPRWAPDGAALIVSGRALRGPGGLFRVNAETGDVEPVVTNPESSASHQVWSPDRRTLFYSANNRIVAREMSTGFEQPLEEGGGNEKAVSPDGDWLAFQRNNVADGTETSIRLVPTAGGTPRALLTLRHPEQVFYFGGLNWTPDGQRLLFVKRSGDRRELAQVHVATGQSEPTGLAAPGLSYVRLHPDGRRLAYSAGRRQEEVWLIEHLLPAAPARTPTVGR